MKLYIMRHSETDWNKEHRIQGRTDIHLNLNGMKIAALAGDGMKDIPIDVCFSSPLVRAQETAALVVARNRHFIEGGSRIILDDRLMEIAFGEWEGQDGSEGTMGPNRELFREFFVGLGGTYMPVGAEDPKNVIRRSQDFLNDICAREDLKDKTVLIVTHGFTLRCLLSRFYEDKDDYFHKPGVLYNCQTAIAEHDAAGQLVLTNPGRLFYDESYARNYYKGSLT
ncbi:MAG: histidine phosphatase family protein [Lachnospiraceae bacterium]|nr:histidine phosphatase family protein [Lachnospiraceae bacterium]